MTSAQGGEQDVFYSVWCVWDLLVPISDLIFNHTPAGQTGFLPITKIKESVRDVFFSDCELVLDVFR